MLLDTRYLILDTKILNTMITITDKAKDKIDHLMQDSAMGSDYFLRVSVKGGGCSGLSYNLDFDNEEQKGDQFFEDKGIKIALDMKSFLYLAGTELDFTDGLNGKGFNFVNPNASRTCGCGESFSV
ncbi:iron-sulfur cluster assembly protein [Pedobacter soli]|uniref:Iron-sulfur cluster assembly protein n=2 Tax=Pedobacter TaxID=84567 RepID=A0A1G6KDA1_9SPHI|nr:iron-sulfur cluster assembly protein [Pedobacter soli]